MRLISMLVVSSIVGSSAVGGLRLLMNEKPQNAFRTVESLYKQNRLATVKLLERASNTCMPNLSDVKSTKLRTVIPSMVTFIVEQKIQGRQLNKADYRKKIINDILNPAMKGASATDITKLSEIIDQTKDKTALVSCIAETVASPSKSEDKLRSNTLLDDVQLRGT